LNLLAGGLQLLKLVLAAEEVTDEELKAVLDLGLFSDGDVATDARPADQDYKSHLQHLFVV